MKHGFKLQLDRENFIDVFCYYWGCWEPNETWAVRRLLGPGQVFVDVGANVGYFSLLASSLVGEQGKVIAIEPVPPTVDKLRENLWLNGSTNVFLNEVAVTDRLGSVRIYQPHDHNIGANTLRSSEGGMKSWEVRTTTLDDMLVGEPSPHLVKLDLEGAELMALRGFTDHLSSPEAPRILCEITDPYLRELGGSARELIELMEGYGYKAYGCDHLIFQPLSSSQVIKAQQINVVFTKQPLGAYGNI
jgi:FkbM family methyltransferase